MRAARRSSEANNSERTREGSCRVTGRADPSRVRSDDTLRLHGSHGTRASGAPLTEEPHDFAGGDQPHTEARPCSHTGDPDADASSGARAGGSQQGVASSLTI